MQVYNPQEIHQAHSQYPPNSRVSLEKPLSLMWLRTGILFDYRTDAVARDYKMLFKNGKINIQAAGYKCAHFLDKTNSRFGLDAKSIKTYPIPHGHIGRISFVWSI